MSARNAPKIFEHIIEGCPLSTAISASRTGRGPAGVQVLESRRLLALQFVPMIFCPHSRGFSAHIQNSSSRVIAALRRFFGGPYSVLLKQEKNAAWGRAQSCMRRADRVIAPPSHSENRDRFIRTYCGTPFVTH